MFDLLPGFMSPNIPIFLYLWNIGILEYSSVEYSQYSTEEGYQCYQYSIEEGYWKKQKIMGKSNKPFTVEVSNIMDIMTSISGIHGKKN